MNGVLVLRSMLLHGKIRIPPQATFTSASQEAGHLQVLNLDNVTTSYEYTFHDLLFKRGEKKTKTKNCIRRSPNRTNIILFCWNDRIENSVYVRVNGAYKVWQAEAFADQL